jgi:hypothetical protein
MRRRSIFSFMVVVALLALAAPAIAGGWAVVTLDSLPQDVRAGQALNLGFMVRQHGQTPINSVEPVLEATNKDSDEMIRINAKQTGPVGHFVADVTFPSAGTWEWQITPAPFGPTEFAPLAVLPAAPASQPAAQPAAQPAPATAEARSIGQDTLRIAGALLLVAAALLALGSKFAMRGRKLAARLAFLSTNKGQ